MSGADLEIRAACESDIPEIYSLLKIYSDRQIVLPRSEENIRSYLKNFTVALRDGRLCGCVALRDFGNELYEVRSLAVHPECQRGGVGRAMVNHCIQKLREKNTPSRLFSLTYQQAFFESLGFAVTDRHLFPEKIWSDCAQCPKHSCCDEIAMIFEVLP